MTDVGEGASGAPGLTSRQMWGGFAVAAVAAVATVLVRNGEQWFYHDDFVFAFDRRLGDPVSLFRPHFGHLTALPAVVFQLVYGVVGLRSYTPYLLLVVLTHVAVAASLLLVMRRCRVDDRIALAATVLFLFYGSGRENLVWAFQTTLNGSLACGFFALALIDRDVVGRRREAAAAALLCVAVLCSNQGPIMCLLVGAVLVIRQGRAPARRVVGSALRVVGPPLGLFVVWLVLAPPGIDAVAPAQLGDAIDWGARSFAYGYVSLTQLVPVAALMFVAVVVATWSLLRRGRWRTTWRTDPLPLLLVAATVAMAANLGHFRGGFYFGPATPRYAYMTVAFNLPVVAWALSRLSAGRRPFVLAAAVLLLIGLPANVVRIGPHTDYDRAHLGRPDLVVAMADYTAVNPPLLGRKVYGTITTDALVRARRTGVLPSTRPGAATRDEAALTVSLVRPVGPAPGPCRAADASRPIRVERGDRVQVDADTIGLSVASSRSGYTETRPLDDDEASERGFDVLAGPLDLRLHGARSLAVRVCR